MTQEQQLAALLSNEIDCLQKLRGILKQEYDALLQADIAALEQVTASKNVALAAQAEITQSRRNLAVQASFSDSDEGLQLLIATCKNQQELLASFSRLSELARECQATNRSNGRLILQKQQQAREALDIIRQTDPNTPTYSVQGMTTESQGTRTLGKA
ncbi:MAG: flagellar biosynthesis/type III secretory pathway chaperone [Bacteroidia bacterium]|jgi:flagellar biosynthesis/type III secretory pathway chaperone